MRTFLAAIAFAALVGCGGGAARPSTMPASTATLPADRAARLASLLDDVEKAKGYPALAIGVVTPDGLAWFGGRGEVDAATKRAVDADTVFRIGSVTKLFSGAAILALRDAGKLDLDDPVEKTVPEIRRVVYPPGAKTPITIRMLLTHRSGFPRLGKVDYTRGDHEITEAELLGELDGLALETTPGTRTHYSNLAMSLTSVIVQRTSGEKYRDYVTHHFFAPLGMQSTYWRREDVPPGRLATGHVRRGDHYVEGPAHWRLGAMEAAGGIYTSTNDFARFARFALAAWKEGEDGGPLKRSTRREWQTAQTKADAGEPAFGINWIVGDGPRLGKVAGHTGSTGDYSASIMMAPDRGVAAIVLLATGESSDADHLVADVLLAGLGQGGGATPAPASGPPKSAADVHLAELAPLLSKLLLAPPTRESLEGVFAPSSKPIEERVAFYERLHKELGACTAIDAGTPSNEQGGIGVFHVTCDKGALEVKAHFEKGKIDWIVVRDAPKPKTADEVHLTEGRALVTRLFSAPPTRELVGAIVASRVDETAAFLERVHADVGACKSVDEGKPGEEDRLGVGIFRVTCDKAAVEVKVHVEGHKIDWINVRPAKP